MSAEGELHMCCCTIFLPAATSIYLSVSHTEGSHTAVLPSFFAEHTHTLPHGNICHGTGAVTLPAPPTAPLPNSFI